MLSTSMLSRSSDTNVFNRWMHDRGVSKKASIRTCSQGVSCNDSKMMLSLRRVPKTNNCYCPSENATIMHILCSQDKEESFCCCREASLVVVRETTDTIALFAKRHLQFAQ